MTSAAYIGLAVLATGAAVVLAGLALGRANSPLSAPLALLALDQFAWNAATLGLHLSGDEHWRWIGAAAAPLFLPLALHFTLTFVGQRHALKRVLQLAYAVFGAQAVAAAAASLFPQLRSHGLGIWAAVLALTALPVAAIGFSLVISHLRDADNTVERLRAALLLAAFVVVGAFAATDLVHDMGATSIPPLSHVGSFAFNTLLGLVAFRLGLLESAGGVRGALMGLLVGLGGAAVALLAFLLVEGNLALVSVAVGSATLGAVVVTRRLADAAASERAQLRQVANAGRFSAQLAHDLKNPLASARGALQFLEEELRQGRPLETNASFLKVVGEQLDRLTSIVERYQHLTKVEPHLVEVDIEQLVRRVVNLGRFAGGPGAQITVSLAPELPRVQADADLLAAALENLVSNAVQALPNGVGRVTVAARVVDSALGSQLELAVVDDGVGMDARTRGLAFEPFFTTRAQGTGLGLPWAKEVVRAHGGTVRLQSRVGAGTTVQLHLPLRPAGTRSRPHG